MTTYTRSIERAHGRRRRERAVLLGVSRRIVLVAALTVVIVPVVGLLAWAAGHGPPTNTRVDFAAAGTPLAPGAFSSTISTYGSENGSIAVSAKQRQVLTDLGAGFYRVPLKWNSGNILSSATGGPVDVSGDSWIRNVKALGAQPMIVVEGNTTNSFNPTDAAAMVRRFNGPGGNPVKYWVLGNEPNNSGMSMTTYCRLFTRTVAAMKDVDPTIKVAGPTWGHYDRAALQQFLNCAGDMVDIVDFHHYAMGDSYVDEATALSQTGQWEDEIRQVRAMLAATVPARADQIQVQVGEYNWSWRTADGYRGYNGDDRFYSPVATVWTASVAGHIAVAGGRGNQYADQNGALGLTFERAADAAHYQQPINGPMPDYQGLRMFTGGSLFRGFGETVQPASTRLRDVEVYASNGPRNIVLVNKSKDTAKAVSIALAGVHGGDAEVWQTDPAKPFATPRQLNSVDVDHNTIQITLPAYSVTTLLLNPSP